MTLAENFSFPYRLPQRKKNYHSSHQHSKGIHKNTVPKEKAFIYVLFEKNDDIYSLLMSPVPICSLWMVSRDVALII